MGNKQSKKYKCGCKKYYLQYGSAHVWCGKRKDQCCGFGLEYKLQIKARALEWWDML